MLTVLIVQEFSIPDLLKKLFYKEDLQNLGLNEPRSEKTSLRSFRPGPTLTGLYNRIRYLEA